MVERFWLTVQESLHIRAILVRTSELQRESGAVLGRDQRQRWKNHVQVSTKVKKDKRKDREVE